MSSEERRRHQRYEVAGVRAVFDGTDSAEILVLGLGGLLVLVGRRPVMNDLVKIELLLEGESFPSDGRVVFVAPGPDPAAGTPRYRVGLAFEEPEHAQQAALARYLERTPQ